MGIRNRRSRAGALILACIGLAGCGGSSGGAFTPPLGTTTPPKSLSIEPNTITDAQNLSISEDVAVRGPRILVGADANQINSVWVGGHQYQFSSVYSQVSLSTANADYAVGSYAAGSLLWPYRGGKTIVVPNDTVLNVAKNADVFFDSGLASDGVTQTASMLTVKNGKAVLTPLNLPSIDPSNFMTGVAINKHGLAVIDVTSFPFDDISRRPTTPITRRALWNAVAAPVFGSGAQRLAAIKKKISHTTTSDSPTGFYLISASGNPIPLALPTNSTGVTVTSINDNGFSVGAAEFGDPSNPSILPCYWDANGNVFMIPISSAANFGFPTDINSEGTVVGEAGNDTDNWGAMWNTVATPETNVATLLASSATNIIFSTDSIGDDYDMAASGTVVNANNDFFYFGLTP